MAVTTDTAFCMHSWLDTSHTYAPQEYLGSYVADERGRLVFREGALVTAVRAGHWLVLDELNLAPSEVLEALNRCACPSAALLCSVRDAQGLLLKRLFM